MDVILEGSELRQKDEGVWHLFVQFTCRLQSQPCWGGSTAFLMTFFLKIIIFNFPPSGFWICSLCTASPLQENILDSELEFCTCSAALDLFPFG